MQADHKWSVEDSKRAALVYFLMQKLAISGLIMIYKYLTFFKFKKKYTNLVSKIKFQPQPDLHQPPEHTGLSEIYFTPLVGS